jgi:hypothetical protein
MRQQEHHRRVLGGDLLQPWPAFPVAGVAFLAASFLYVWLRVEPALDYHAYGPFFYCRTEFFESCLGVPGGLLVYVGTFLAQLNHLSWLGALVFMFIQAIALLLSFAWLASVGVKSPGLGALVVPFGLLLLRNRYGCPVSAISIGLLLALVAGVGCLCLPWRRPWLLTLVSGLISSGLFWLGGLWCGLLFAGLCGVFLVVRFQGWWASAGCVLLALALPWLAVAAGWLRMEQVVYPWPGTVPMLLAVIVYALAPLTGILMLLRAKSVAVPSTSELNDPAQMERLRWGALVLVGLLLCAAVWYPFDRQRKILAQMDYDASRGNYEGVLAAAKEVKILDDPAKIRMQWALFHTDRLAEELFSFRNMAEEVRFNGLGAFYRAQSQPSFELGLINDAEHVAHEALQIEGERPDLLRLLARVNLLKNRPEAAQVFLNVLSTIPFQGQRAYDAWPAPEAQRLTAELTASGSMPAQLLARDFLHDGLPLGRLVDGLLAANPTNRMAFEYAMADHLMELELEKAIEHLQLLRHFGYPRLPRTYEEAVLLFQQTAKVQVDLQGRTIRLETLERFRQFGDAVRQFRGTVEDQKALAAGFGDTYWYYYFAVRSRQRAKEGQAAPP